MVANYHTNFDIDKFETFEQTYRLGCGYWTNITQGESFFSEMFTYKLHKPTNYIDKYKVRNHVNIYRGWM